MEFDRGYFCQNCEYFLNKQKHQIHKKKFGQDRYLSTRVPFANKKVREIFYSLVNGKYETTQDMNNKLQLVKGKTKLKFYQNICKYYDEMNYRGQSNIFQFEGHPFSKNAEGISKIYHEVLKLMKFLQTKTSKNI